MAKVESDDEMLPRSTTLRRNKDRVNRDGENRQSEHDTDRAISTREPGRKLGSEAVRARERARSNQRKGQANDIAIGDGIESHLIA